MTATFLTVHPGPVAWLCSIGWINSQFVCRPVRLFGRSSFYEHDATPNPETEQQQNDDANPVCHK
jgi:hypothetical protein